MMLKPWTNEMKVDALKHAAAHTYDARSGERVVLPLAFVIDQVVLNCGLDPAKELGARVKLAVCELYERVPRGFGDYIDIVVRHDQTCATIRGDGDCDCERTVEIGYPDAGEPVIVH